jgi:hypothetical protein
LTLQYDNIERFKYRLTADFKFTLPGEFPKMTYPLHQPDEWIRYDDESGTLYYEEGYCWDGSSGPTVDSKQCHLAGLIHDAGYQLLREGVFGARTEKQKAREFFDNLYYILCIAGGMGRKRAWLRWKALRLLGKKAANAY